MELARTLRVTLTACALLPCYIDHAAHLDPNRERLLDFLKKAATLWKTKTLMRKLKKKSIPSLTEESITSMASVFGQLHPCRIVPHIAQACNVPNFCFEDMIYHDMWNIPKLGIDKAETVRLLS